MKLFFAILDLFLAITYYLEPEITRLTLPIIFTQLALLSIVKEDS